MTDTGPVRPRRALGPLPDDDAGGPVTLGGSRALPFDPDWAPADTETQVLRRVMPGPAVDDLRSPASPASPSATGDGAPSPASPASPPLARGWSPTPVPPPQPAPPKPVLPQTTAALHASAGRRFSASAEPSEFAPAAPRRSATSVSSPPPVEFDPPLSAARPSSVPPATSVAAPSTAAGSAAGPADPPADDAAQPPRRRSRGRALAVVAGVVMMAGAVAGSVWWLGPQEAPPAVTSPSPTPSVGLDPLLTPADLAVLRATDWVPANPPDGEPICLTSDDALPEPDRTGRRAWAVADQPTTRVLHTVETYADPMAARRAYNARLQQAGNCSDTEALIVDTSTVTGLADAAFASHIEAQAEAVEHHSLVVSQAGRNLSVVDVSSAEPVALDDAATLAAKPLARLCSGGEGTCPATVELTATVPAAGQYPGWLIKADLPRITASAGRWGATRPSSVLTILGSQCEAVSLKKVADASSAQRTLLLGDDPAAPAGFGIDQVVYTFASGKDAKTFGDKLASNLADCADRVPTATVKKGPSTKGEAAGGVAFSGKSYLITQQTAEDEEVPFRVAVVRVGDHIAYLLANPSAEFDFTTDQWQAIMTRTAQRVSQLP